MKLEFRAGRAGFDFLVQPGQARLKFLWLQDGDGLGKRLRIEVEKKRNREALEISHGLGRFHRRAGQNARVPRLFAQALREDREQILRVYRRR